MLIIPLEPLCVEKFNEYPLLRRILIREHKGIVGVGFVKDVVGYREISIFLVTIVNIKLKLRIPKYLVFMIIEHYERVTRFINSRVY